MTASEPVIPDAGDAGELCRPWSGNLHEEELLRPGGTLVAALVQCAFERGHTMTRMAHELGVTYGYVCHLRNGTRDVKDVSDTFTRECAAYLGVPRLTVLAMSGKIDERDYYESKASMDAALPAAMEYIYRDAAWAPLVPEALRQSGSLEVQYLVVRLYEQATEMRLLPERLNLGQVVDAVKEVEKFRQERLHQLASAEEGKAPA